MIRIYIHISIWISYIENEISNMLILEILINEKSRFHKNKDVQCTVYSVQYT